MLKNKYFKNDMPMKMKQNSKYEDGLKIKGIGRFQPYIIMSYERKVFWGGLHICPTKLLVSTLPHATMLS